MEARIPSESGFGQFAEYAADRIVRLVRKDGHQPSVKVTAQSGGAGRAHALQAQGRTWLRTLGYLDALGSRQRRNLDGTAQDEHRHRHLQLAPKVVAIPAENRILIHHDAQVQVTTLSLIHI